MVGTGAAMVAGTRVLGGGQGGSGVTNRLTETPL